MTAALAGTRSARAAPKPPPPAAASGRSGCSPTRSGTRSCCARVGRSAPGSIAGLRQRQLGAKTLRRMRKGSSARSSSGSRCCCCSRQRCGSPRRRLQAPLARRSHSPAATQHPAQPRSTWGCTIDLSRPLHKSSPFVSTATVHPKWFKEWDRQQVRERSIVQGVVR